MSYEHPLNCLREFWGKNGSWPFIRCAPKKRVASLPVFDMGEPRVNIAYRDQLWELMERE
jgi:hypothetical protein